MIAAHPTFTAVAGRETSAEFAKFFDEIGAPQDKGMAFVTYMRQPEGVFNYGPPQLGALENKQLFDALAIAARKAAGAA